MIIKLNRTKIYPQYGHSKAYEDKDKNKYWLCTKYEKVEALNFGKLFIGDIEDKNPQTALGQFKLMDSKITIKQY